SAGGGAHPVDWGRRLVRGDHRGGGGHQHSRGDGNGRGGGGRADGGGAGVFEWTNTGAAGGGQAARRGAAGENGSEGSQADLRHRGFGAGEENDFCVLRGDGRKFAEGR